MLTIRSLWTIDRDADAVFDALAVPEVWCAAPVVRRHAAGRDGDGGVVELHLPAHGGLRSHPAEVAVVTTLEVRRPWRVTWRITGDLRGTATWELDDLGGVTDVGLELDVEGHRAPVGGRRRHEAAVTAAVHRAGTGLAAHLGGRLQRSVTTAPGGYLRHAAPTGSRSLVR